MTDSDITTTILRLIRDEIVKSNTRLDTLTERASVTNQRLDALTEHASMTNQRLDALTERVTVVESVLRDLAGQVAVVGRYIDNEQDAEIADLRKRVVRLEKKVG